MKKLLVSAAVLLLAGVAVAGAFHVKSSIERGVCPLTGKPIACRSHAPSATPAAAECPPTPDCPFTDSRCAEHQATATSAAPAALASDADETVCPKTHRSCCCPKKQQAECAKESKPVEQPADPATKPYPRTWTETFRPSAAR